MPQQRQFVHFFLRDHAEYTRTSGRAALQPLDALTRLRRLRPACGAFVTSSSHCAPHASVCRDTRCPLTHFTTARFLAARRTASPFRAHNLYRLRARCLCPICPMRARCRLCALQSRAARTQRRPLRSIEGTLLRAAPELRFARALCFDYARAASCPIRPIRARCRLCARSIIGRRAPLTQSQVNVATHALALTPRSRPIDLSLA